MLAESQIAQHRPDGHQGDERQGKQGVAGASTPGFPRGGGLAPAPVPLQIVEQLPLQVLAGRSVLVLIQKAGGQVPVQLGETVLEDLKIQLILPRGIPARRVA